MPKEQQNFNPYDTYQNGDNLKKFTDDLLEKKGKILELYIGDQCETLNFDESSIPQNCSIFGRLVDVLDRFVILNCFYFDEKTKQLRDDNIVYVNLFQIRVMTELNENGCLDDVFLNARSAKKIREKLIKEFKK